MQPATAQVRIVDAYPDLSFTRPTDFQVADSTTNYVYVTERQGIIHRFENDSTVSITETVLDISDRVDTQGEGGLLGLAFHPDYPDTNYGFIYYTAPDPFQTIVSKFRIDTASHTFIDTTETVIFDLEQPYSNHNGGQIRFGPDGYLYIALGDGGAGGDPQDNGQDPSTFLGSILRINVDTQQGDKSYGIPQNNPFVDNDQGYLEEIYAYGLRNPYRFSFDAKTGELWAGDVGQNEIEEIDIIEKGKNYGWNVMEGTQCFEPETGCDTAGLTMPIYEYTHSDGRSITGGFVYRGSRIPELQGQYIYGDFAFGTIWALETVGDSVVNNREIGNVSSNVAFGEDRNNELYICSFDGNIYTLRGAGTDTTDIDRDHNSEVPSTTDLYQNYPNPFNPATNIRFKLDQAQHISINVYNSAGRLIETLVDERFTAGQHMIPFNGADLTSGTYIYELQTPTDVLRRKMTLIK